MRMFSSALSILSFAVSQLRGAHVPHCMVTKQQLTVLCLHVLGIMPAELHSLGGTKPLLLQTVMQNPAVKPTLSAPWRLSAAAAAHCAQHMPALPAEAHWMVRLLVPAIQEHSSINSNIVSAQIPYEAALLMLRQALIPLRHNLHMCMSCMPCYVCMCCTFALSQCP